MQLLRVLDDVRGSWRFRWWALAAAWTVCLAGWLSVISLPNVFQASARVYVDTQSALRPLLKGLAVDPDVESNLAVVRQAILSRPNLEKVARQTDLDLRAKTPEEMEHLIDGLGKRIVIEADVRARTSTSDGLYRISFQDFNRTKSLEVVRTLLDSFVEDTLGSKRTGQEDAQRFLREQIADYERQLSAAETRLSEFKKRNVGSMPSDRGDYFTRLQTEMTGLDQARKGLALAETRRAELTRQLSGEEPVIFGLDAQTGAAGPTSAGGGDVAFRIRDLEHRLEELLLKYTDKHPEVIAVRKTIEDLKARQADELARMQHGSQGTGSLAQSLKANPVYQSTQVELNRTDVQIAELRQDVAQRQARVAELQRMVNTVPDVEAELARLNRDYEVTRSQYQQLVQRLETAKLSEEAEKTGVVKFQVIDPPAVSYEPVAPNRAVFLTAVLLLGLAAAVAVAYLLDQLRPVFQNVRALAEITGLPVLGLVSRIWVDKHKAEARRNVMAFSGAFALLLLTFGAALLWRDAGAIIIQQLKG